MNEDIMTIKINVLAIIMVFAILAGMTLSQNEIFAQDKPILETNQTKTEIGNDTLVLVPDVYRVVSDEIDIPKNGGIKDVIVKCKGHNDVPLGGGYRIINETNAKDIVIIEDLPFGGAEGTSIGEWKIKAQNNNPTVDIKVLATMLCRDR